MLQFSKITSHYYEALYISPQIKCRNLATIEDEAGPVAVAMEGNNWESDIAIVWIQTDIDNECKWKLCWVSLHQS